MKKWLPYIYSIYLILCIGYIVYGINQQRIGLLSERYGTETNGVVELTDESEVTVNFCLNHENFAGLSVKFESDEEFQSEKIKASLYDKESQELLAVDIVELKNELIRNNDSGSSIYFALPVRDAEDREIQLSFLLEGEDIQVYPKLVVSKSKITDSVLIVDGKRFRRSLVFTTRYETAATRDVVGTVASGILWAIAGGIIILWLSSKEKHGFDQAAANSGFSKKTGLTNSKALVFTRRHIQKICFGVWIFFLGILFVYVYQYGVESVIVDTGAAFLKRMYLILCVLLLMCGIVLYYFCFVRQVSLSKMFVIFSISFGIIFSSVIALYTVPDEPSHIDTAYQLSNKLLGVPDSTRPNHIYKRADDVDSYVEDMQKLGLSNYEFLYQNLFTMIEDETLVECSVLNNLSNAGNIYYFPQAVGLSVGRLLKLGFLPAMMLGRLFSLIAYVGLVYLAIRKLPFAKVSMFLVAVLPITLQQAASFSYDAMINAISFLFVSYCLYIGYDETEIRVSDLIVILITGCMLATVKGGVYLPLCFLPLLTLVAQKKLTKRQRTCIIMLVGLCLLFFVNDRLIGTLNRLLTEQGTATGGANSAEIYTFGYLIRHPKQFIGMFVNTFYKQGDSYVRNMLGGNLAWRDVNINWSVVFGFLLFILISCIRTGNEPKVSGGQKFYMGVLCLGTYGLLELSMVLVWTPVTYTYITGVQGRYFLPFFPLILVVMKNSFFRLKKNIDRILIFGVGALDIIVVLQVVQKVLER